MVELVQTVPLVYTTLGGKDVGKVQQSCHVIRLSRQCIEVAFEGTD